MKIDKELMDNTLFRELGPAAANSTIMVVNNAQKKTVEEMVLTSLEMLNEKNGSSLHAIKKYISNNYASNIDKLAIYIKKFLKTAVQNGKVIQTKGKGANGSFKLPKAAEKTKKNIKVQGKTLMATEEVSSEKEKVKKIKKPRVAKKKLAAAEQMKVKDDAVAVQVMTPIKEDNEENIKTTQKKGKSAKRKSLIKVVGVTVNNNAKKRISVGGKVIKVNRRKALMEETPTTSKKAIAAKKTKSNT